jgi:hypothetical protein
MGENTEGLYSGIEYRLTPDVAIAVRKITRRSCERILRKAFLMAEERGWKTVVCSGPARIKSIRGLPFYRSALLWTFGVAPPVSGIIWLFVFHPSYGILTYLLAHITTYEFNWLLKGWIALLLVIFAASWAHLGYNVAFFLAGLQTIPLAVLEAVTGQLFLAITIARLVGIHASRSQGKEE